MGRRPLTNWNRGTVRPKPPSELDINKMTDAELCELRDDLEAIPALDKTPHEYVASMRCLALTLERGLAQKPACVESPKVKLLVSAIPKPRDFIEAESTPSRDYRPFVCEAVYVLNALGRCYKCRATTRLWALMALPPFHNDDANDPEFDDEDCPMLTEIEAMPASLEALVAARTNNHWRADRSDTAGSTYWMNHCEHCDARQGDHFVHGPEGEFHPNDDQAEDAIHAERVGGPHSFDGVGVSRSGAMSDWRERRDGIQREPIDLRSLRRLNAAPELDGGSSK